jgi:hypothetical protein
VVQKTTEIIQMKSLSKITEVLFPYDAAEYSNWASADREVSNATVKARIDVCGPMGRNVDTYTNQANANKGRQNYPEVVFACHLVASGYAPQGLIYENYSFSKQVIERKRGKRFPLNVAKLRNVLAENFFREFDRLLDINSQNMGGRKRGGMIVDLVAIDTNKRRLGIYEVKKYSPGAKTTEPFPKHQQLTIAALRHIFATLGADAFVGPPWSVSIDLISFVPEPDLQMNRIQPASYSLEFNT